MLTNEKVLEVFKDYLSQEPEYEVVLTSHGYTVMCWNIKGEEWLDAEYCKTPQDLLDALLTSYGNYLEDLIARSNRDLSEQEEREVQDKKNAMKQKCQEY